MPKNKIFDDLLSNKWYNYFHYIFIFYNDKYYFTQSEEMRFCL